MSKIILHTKRLTLKTNNLIKMQEILNAEKDMDIKTEYQEMIDEMNRIPGNEEWACEWSIFLRGTDTIIGGIGFKGMAKEMGDVELGYEIREDFRCQGYATEAVAGIVEWALMQKGVKCVLAQTYEDNYISQKVLLKNGFARHGYGKEGPLFIRRA